MGSDSINLGLKNIWYSWFAFRKGKPVTSELEAFQFYLEKNLFNLFSDLNNGFYRHGAYRAFTVCDNKRREISVAGIRDRVVHRLVHDYLIAIYDRIFILVDPDLERLKVCRLETIHFFTHTLRLKLSPKSDRLLRAKSGLRFLGVVIRPDGRILNRWNRKRIKRRLNVRNAGSYYGLIRKHGMNELVEIFPWYVLNFI